MCGRKYTHLDVIRNTDKDAKEIKIVMIAKITMMKTVGVVIVELK